MEQQISEMFKLLKAMDERQKTFQEEVRTSFKNVSAEFKSVQTEIGTLHTDNGDITKRLIRIENKLDGAGYQFEQSTGDRLEDIGFLINKINKMEQEIYRISKNQNN